MAGDLGHRLAAARIKVGLTQEEVAHALGLQRSSVAYWETGRSYPTTKNLLALAGLYHTTPNELLGLPTDTESRFPSNLVEVPIVGHIPAGRLVLTEATIEGHKWLDEERVSGGLHFLLRVKGYCMWPRFHDGDLALVRKQDTIENGELAIVTVDDESTMKKVKREGNMVGLWCDNPAALADPTNHPLMVHASRVRIIGKVVGGEWG